IPGAPSNIRGRSLLRDRDGGLWIGTLTHGLFHVHGGKTDAYTPIDGLSGAQGHGGLEDREGSIWISTEKGIDRFGEFPIPTFSAGQGLSGTFFYTSLASRDGSIWVTTTDGLKRWNRGAVTSYRGHGTPSSPAQKEMVREVLVSAMPDHLTSLFEDH